MRNDVLHAFVEVIDARSFSKAAEKLYLSSTALMKHWRPHHFYYTFLTSPECIVKGKN